MIIRQPFILNFRNLYHKIIQQSTVCVSTGHCWDDDRLYKETNFTKLIVSKYVKVGVNESSWIPNNGQFAYVVIKDNCLFAIVDRVRSIPIFYGHKDNEFFISDDARWVRAKLNDYKPYPLAVTEFRYAGFVTGRETLFPKVKQLQAGECLLVQNGADGLEVMPYRYYAYIGKNFFASSLDELVPLLDIVFLHAFERLIQYANGRTLVVPLSAGLDSRLVVSMIKRLNYENVICYSYGKKNNEESSASLKVARKLDYKWIFIPYSRISWRNWFKSKVFQMYMNYSDNLCSLPHIQDWPAVLEMKNKQLIPDDSIFVPGHTGDFIAGGHIPPDFENFGDNSSLNKVQLIEKILKKHYRVNDFNSASYSTQSAIIDKIDSLLPKISINSCMQAGSIYEYYDWQERQPKHVLNSLRIYEFFGYSWYIPLWDTKIMQFWQRIPFEQKSGKLLYKHYLEQKNFFGVFSNLLTDERRRNSSLKKHALINRLSGLYHNYGYHRVESYRKRYLDYFLHEYQYFGIYSYAHVALKNGFSQNIYSFLVDSYLEQFK